MYRPLQDNTFKIIQRLQRLASPIEMHLIETPAKGNSNYKRMENKNKEKNPEPRTQQDSSPLPWIIMHVLYR